MLMSSSSHCKHPCESHAQSQVECDQQLWRRNRIGTRYRVFRTTSCQRQISTGHGHLSEVQTIESIEWNLDISRMPSFQYLCWIKERLNTLTPRRNFRRRRRRVYCETNVSDWNGVCRKETMMKERIACPFEQWNAKDLCWLVIGFLLARARRNLRCVPLQRRENSPLVRAFLELATVSFSSRYSSDHHSPIDSNRTSNILSSIIRSLSACSFFSLVSIIDELWDDAFLYPSSLPHTFSLVLLADSTETNLCLGSAVKDDFRDVDRSEVEETSRLPGLVQI